MYWVDNVGSLPKTHVGPPAHRALEVPAKARRVSAHPSETDASLVRPLETRTRSLVHQVPNVRTHALRKAACPFETGCDSGTAAELVEAHSGTV